MDCMNEMMGKMMGPGTDQTSSTTQNGNPGKGDGSMNMHNDGMMSMVGSMMMGGAASGESTGFNPMDMCRKMMGMIGKTSEIATFATPEIRGLFEEWVIQIEEEIMQFVRSSTKVEPESIAAHFKLTKESIVYFLTRLAQKGKIILDVKPALS